MPRKPMLEPRARTKMDLQVGAPLVLSVVTVFATIVVTSWKLRGAIDAGFTSIRVEVKGVSTKLGEQTDRVNRIEDNIVRCENRIDAIVG